jgi:hypothetical protein
MVLSITDYKFKELSKFEAKILLKLSQVTLQFPADQ